MKAKGSWARAASTCKGPTIPYPGAKARMAPMLVSLMPTSGRTYMEPFVGRGNMFWTAALNLDFKQWHINDNATAPFFLAVQDRGHVIDVPERTRVAYDQQKVGYLEGDPCAILLEPYLTFNGGGYKRAGYGSSHGSTASGYESTLRRCHSIMHMTRAKVTAFDWHRLRLDRLCHDDFVFLDPPYFGADVRAYTNDFDFDGLVTVLRRARFRWMLTEYRQPFYVRAFGEPVFQKTVQLACDGIGTRQRVECVWTNFMSSRVALTA